MPSIKNVFNIDEAKGGEFPTSNSGVKYSEKDFGADNRSDYESYIQK